MGTRNFWAKIKSTQRSFVLSTWNFFLLPKKVYSYTNHNRDRRSGAGSGDSPRLQSYVPMSDGVNQGIFMISVNNGTGQSMCQIWIFSTIYRKKGLLCGWYHARRDVLLRFFLPQKNKDIKKKREGKLYGINRFWPFGQSHHVSVREQYVQQTTAIA